MLIADLAQIERLIFSFLPKLSISETEVKQNRIELPESSLQVDLCTSTANMFDNLSTKQKVALAVALPSSMVLLYLLFKKRDNDDGYRPPQSLATEQRKQSEMTIPHNKVGPFIGRDGCNIKRLQAESGAHIKFQDETRRDDKSDRHLKIFGNRESVLLAERMINEFLAEQPEIISRLLLIPQQAVGRVIGREGSNIRKIQTSSKAKVKIDRESAENHLTMRECTLRGTLQQVDCAEAMIREEVNEVEDYNQRLAEAASKRKQRPTGKQAQTAAGPPPGATSPPQPSLPPQPPLTVQTAPKPEEQWVADPDNMVEPPSSRDFFTVFISAVDHPEHFWVQIVNSKARQLDLLLETMTEFYNAPENRESFPPDDLQVGGIIAAPFAHDQSWYRARILGFLDNDELDLYYVDYGDCAAIARSAVCSLRDDFLTLPFQAVEFSLANIAPVGDQWSEEAIECFEELTSVAKWKPLSAKIIDYQTTDSGTMPCVDLYDISRDNDVNIAKELRYRGFAKTCKSRRERLPVTTETASNGDAAQNTSNSAQL